METRVLGGSRAEIPIIGQGTWMMERDPDGSVEAIRRGLDLGMTHIDTAEMYGSGRVEEIVGQALADRRDRVFLASKVLPQNASLDGTIEACERSLGRLGTDHLDLYLLHWPSRHPLEDTFAAFERLREEGKVRHWGVSNFGISQMEKALRIAGEGAIVCNQVSYHLKDLGIEDDLITYCHQRKIAVVGYSPFGQGDFPKRDRTLKRIAGTHQATPYQIALVFLTRRDGTFAIPKSSKVEHVEANAAASEITLTDAEVADIEAAFR
jgi:diketogulonate reductase-like aldo/keto reductase